MAARLVVRYAVVEFGEFAGVPAGRRADHVSGDALDAVDLMDKYNIGYASVNHSRNRCMDCGDENAEKHYNKCRVCGSTNIDRIQRITGYLVGTTSRWNSGKLAELHDRVTHD